ncbi:uncharacterized protein PG998_006938 [Apiospora kogelbergensis]|uniref:uncharacterized protein n=1 Tax=Apiospora kogelbergensis TaxID=1337665 RepID=UPI00312E0BB1
MCKQYVYFSLCLNRDCDSTVGKKGRNKYCCAARHGARRLGSCDSGVEFIVIEHYRGILFCDESTEEGDGGISDDFSSETIEGEDGEAEEAPGSLRFFANKKIKVEKLASAFNFDLALQQEITAQNIDSLDVDDPGEGDDLFVVSGKDDSTIEYEDKVPEPTRCKNQPTPKIYYGFDAAEVGESPKKFPRLNPHSRADPGAGGEMEDEKTGSISRYGKDDDRGDGSKKTRSPPTSLGPMDVADEAKRRPAC